MSHIEFRFSEQSFRKYEQAIDVIVAHFPRTVIVKCGTRSINTVRCRLRDSVRGVMEHNYPTSIDLDKLRNLWGYTVLSETYEDGEPKMVIKCKPGYPNSADARSLNPVVFEFNDRITRSAEKTDRLVHTINSGVASTASIDIYNPNLSEVKALLLLHNNDRLSNPSKLTNITDDIKQYITVQTEFDNTGHTFIDDNVCIIA